MKRFSELRNDDIKPVDTEVIDSIEQGKRQVEVETYMVDEEDNCIGFKVLSIDGEPCELIREDGNAVAVALDMLTGLELPLNSKFKINIEFSSTTNGLQEV